MNIFIGQTPCSNVQRAASQFSRLYFSLSSHTLRKSTISDKSFKNSEKIQKRTIERKNSLCKLISITAEVRINKTKTK